MIGNKRLKSEQIAKIWLASLTNRWHQNTHMSANTDYIVGHSGRVALLMLGLFPDASRENIIACLVHDLGESQSGDIHGPAKNSNPELKKALDVVETNTLREMGCLAQPTSMPWSEIIKMCDRLDALLFAQLHRPDLMQRGDWIESKARVFQMADDCGVNLEVADIIRWAA